MRYKDETIRQVAARWYARIQASAPDALERTSFEMWLMTDERHRRAYQRVEATMEQLRADKTHLPNSIADTPTCLLADRASHQRLSKLGYFILACLLSVALGFVSRAYYMQWQAAPRSSQVQVTAMAQLLKRTLDDGSVVTANANTVMEIVFYRDRRIVKLKQGEAIFEVAKDPQRPFVVETAHATVKVLGARFAVNLLSQKLRISVDHGQVSLARMDRDTSPRLLHQGEVAEIEQTFAPHLVQRNAADGFSFVHNRIVFDRADMFEVADTLSRYRIPAVRAMFFGNQTPKVNAVIHTSEIETFIKTLPHYLPVTLNMQKEALVIEPQPF